MSDELKIKIQWLPGAILLVRVNQYSPVSELSDFLQFSCFSDEMICLFHNGEILNYDETLVMQGIRDNDIIDCKIVQKYNIFGEEFSSSRHSIAREMARILDMAADKKGIVSDISKSDSESSYSDSDTYQYTAYENNDLASVKEISSDPLPIIWEK